MRRAEIITAFILGLFSVYLMWKSGEPPAWNPDAARFDNIGYDDTGAPGSGFWPFWLGVIMLASCVWTGINWALRHSPASVSTAPFLDSYGWKMHGWAVTLSIATAVPVVCFFFFDIAMRIVLPKGYSEPLFIPLYDIFL